MEDNRLDGLSSLISLAGVSVPARARFVGEALMGATLASLTVGLTAGMIGAVTPAGPLIPFLMGSWTGYTFGLVRHWQMSAKFAIQCAQQYPSLLAHSLLADRFVVVPERVVEVSEERLKQRQYRPVYKDTEPKEMEPNQEKDLEGWICEAGIGRLSWAILAAQNCRSDVEELRRMERQKLMDKYNDNI